MAVDWASIASAGGAIIDSIFNFIGNERKNTKQEEIQREVNKSNEKINQDNIEYNTKMTQLQWERDDNAHQREVADLEKAGLSPLASTTGGANGTPLGAPSPISMQGYEYQAPQLDTNQLINSMLQVKQLNETERHNKQTEKYKEAELENTATELKQNAEKLTIENKKVEHQIKQDTSLLELQNKQIEEQIRNHKKDEELRLSENETRIMAEESQRFLQEVQSQAGGKDVPYEVLDDFEIYSNRMRLYTVEYNNFIKEIEATSKSSGSSSSSSGGASVGGSVVGTGVNVGVNGSGSDSSYSSENISKKQEAMLQKFRQTHKVPVYIPKGKYKSIKTTNY